MESSEAREQAVYGMVKQVLQHQITTHDVSLGVALTGCAMMLTSACLALYDTADVIALLFHQHQNTLVDLEAMIDETLQPVMLQQMRRSQHDTGQG
jgi:hypothetical protein